MANGYSQSPLLLKGALIQFSAPMFVPVPNIIVFQYNPETLTRTLSPWQEPQVDEEGKLVLSQRQYSQLRQPFDPEESFSVTLELDATDDLERPELRPQAVVSGVADRLAAIEMLCYPARDGPGLNILPAVTVGPRTLNPLERADILPRLTVPVVLFFWGPGRVVPVRLTGLTIEEQAFSPLLYPIRAKATVSMKVLTESAFNDMEQTAAVQLAKAAYVFTRAQKEALAAANFASLAAPHVTRNAEAIKGMLPI